MEETVIRPKRLTIAALTAALLAPAMVAEADSAEARSPHSIRFAHFGPASGPEGRHSFRFGVSSSATQIEDGNTNTDWYHWTRPKADGGLGHGQFVGDGVGGYTKALDDVDLVKDMNLDSYRLNIEWARVEPKRGQFDEAALQHYGDLLDKLRAQGIHPMVTLHHFANPVWVDNPDDPGCANGPSDTNLCGLDSPTGGPLVVQAMAEYAKVLAQRFGDRVDDWATVNEPMVYMLFSHAFGAGPPGKAELVGHYQDKFQVSLRTYISAHAAMYKAIKKYDTVSADGTGPAANVGLTISAKQYVPVRNGKVSTDPADIAAADRFRRFFELNFVDAIRQGGFSTKDDGVYDEPHPEWKNTMDWLGVQLYDRTGVSDPGATPGPTTLPVVNVDVCGLAPCLPPLDPSYVIPTMGYATDPTGLYPVLKDFSGRYPGLPLIVTENGLATDSGERRSQIIVRALESIDKARAEGVDVRGYYHWSLMDNFEWLQGYGPHFGLYSVDRTTMARTPTSAAAVYGDIAAHRGLTPALRRTYGGNGPLSPEPTPGQTPAGTPRLAAGVPAASGRRD
ncbi:glycoside hydrolase family 1 protein [Kitasatospora sp. NPDC051170]|uniref:glycoside hydrolase family 1 protein n=1 Tax=Kitasatospora sp. NPDC051170 TaxID=3364056 RepID=UPI0037BE1CE8